MPACHCEREAGMSTAALLAGCLKSFVLTLSYLVFQFPITRLPHTLSILTHCTGLLLYIVAQNQQLDVVFLLSIPSASDFGWKDGWHTSAGRGRQTCIETFASDCSDGSSYPLAGRTQDRSPCMVVNITPAS